MIEALTYYVAEQAGTTEFSTLDSQSDYLLRNKSKNSEALKMLEKTSKAGYETGELALCWQFGFNLTTCSSQRQ